MTEKDGIENGCINVIPYLIKNGSLCLYSFSYKTIMLGNSSVALVKGLCTLVGLSVLLAPKQTVLREEMPWNVKGAKRMTSGLAGG